MSQEALSGIRETLGAVHASLSTLEAAALTQETQSDLILKQGQSNGQELGKLTAAVGELVHRLGHYLEDANQQGSRLNTLEREVRELRARQ